MEEQVKLSKDRITSFGAQIGLNTLFRNCFNYNDTMTNILVLLLMSDKPKDSTEIAMHVKTSLNIVNQTLRSLRNDGYVTAFLSDKTGTRGRARNEYAVTIQNFMKLKNDIQECLKTMSDVANEFIQSVEQSFAQKNNA